MLLLLKIVQMFQNSSCICSGLKDGIVLILVDSVWISRLTADGAFIETTLSKVTSHEINIFSRTSKLQGDASFVVMTNYIITEGQSMGKCPEVCGFTFFLPSFSLCVFPLNY